MRINTFVELHLKYALRKCAVLMSLYGQSQRNTNIPKELNVFNDIGYICTFLQQTFNKTNCQFITRTNSINRK